VTPDSVESTRTFEFVKDARCGANVTLSGDGLGKAHDGTRTLIDLAEDDLQV
jgi:hypothetical protein